MKKKILLILILIAFSKLINAQIIYDLENNEVKVNKSNITDSVKSMPMPNLLANAEQILIDNQSASQSTVQPVSIVLNDGMTQYTYTYNEAGKVLTELWETLQPYSYVNKILTTNTYDANNNLILAVEEHDSRIYSKLAYTYNDNNQILTLLSEYYSKSLLTTTTKITYNYDSSSKLSNYIREKYTNTIWSPLDKCNYCYDEQGELFRKTYQSWNNEIWVNDMQFTGTYDDNRNLLTQLSEQWDVVNNSWVAYQKSTYTYDNNNNKLTSFFESYDTGSCSRKTYTYTIMGQLLTELVEVLSNEKWEVDSRTTSTFDANYHIVSTLEELFFDDATSTRKYLYNCDADGNTTSCECFVWDFNMWLPMVDYYLYVYYNNFSTKLELYGYYAEIQYTPFTDVKEEFKNPNSFILSQNYPNPFNPSTTILFSIPAKEFVTLKIYDALGKEITTLVNEEIQPGTYQKEWFAGDLSSGVYFYRLQAGKFSETKKLLLLK